MEQKLSQNRILVFDQESLMLSEIHNLINSQADLVSCGLVSGGISLPAAISLEKPDLLLLGIRFNNGDSFELANALRLEFPGLPILAFSEGDETLYAERALQVGAKGYIMKQEPGHEFLTAIRTVLSGKIYLSHSVSVGLVQRVLKPGASRSTQNLRESQSCKSNRKSP